MKKCFTLFATFLLIAACSDSTTASTEDEIEATSSASLTTEETTDSLSSSEVLSSENLVSSASEEPTEETPADPGSIEITDTLLVLDSLKSNLMEASKATDALYQFFLTKQSTDDDIMYMITEKGEWNDKMYKVFYEDGTYEMVHSVVFTVENPTTFNSSELLECLIGRDGLHHKEHGVWSVYSGIVTITVNARTNYTSTGGEECITEEKYAENPTPTIEEIPASQLLD